MNMSLEGIEPPKPEIPGSNPGRRTKELKGEGAHFQFLSIKLISHCMWWISDMQWCFSLKAVEEL